MSTNDHSHLICGSCEPYPSDKTRALCGAVAVGGVGDVCGKCESAAAMHAQRQHIFYNPVNWTEIR